MSTQTADGPGPLLGTDIANSKNKRHRYITHIKFDLIILTSRTTGEVSKLSKFQCKSESASKI